jgi:hypothetical protein
MIEFSNEMDRRRFVQLLVASAAVAATTPVAAVARAETSTTPSPTAKTARHAPPSAAQRKEIESQKKSLADALHVIRDFNLPAGSPPAFVFRALKREGKPR